MRIPHALGWAAAFVALYACGRTLPLDAGPPPGGSTGPGGGVLCAEGETECAGICTDLDEDPESYVAVSTRCAHLGCPVRFYQAAGNFICPCHGGVYDFDGGVSGGPPVRPLERFYVRVRDGQVQVGPRYSVNSEFRRFPSYRDPGQALDGIGQYMYPGRFSTPKLD